jgi:flagellar basal-body rod protein FlgC
MVAAVSSVTSYATSAIATADAQIAAVTSSISNQIDGTPPSSSTFGSSAVAAPPVTGTQPSSAASQVFQAQQTDQTATTGTAPSASRSSDDDVSYQPESPAADAQGLVSEPNPYLTQQSQQLSAAAASFTNSVQALQTPSQSPQRLLDVTT